MLLFGLTPTRYSVDEMEEWDEDINFLPREIPLRRALTDKVIVLDMDLTLLCTIGDGSDVSSRLRSHHKTAYENLLKRGVVVPTVLTPFGGNGKPMQNDVVRRPGVEEFLNFCRIVFKNVILWSAGQASYVYDTVKKVLDPEDKGIFDYVYTAQDVVQYSIVESDDQFAKNLRSAGYSNFAAKPLQNVRARFPNARLNNTVIVDDIPCNFFPNPKNGVLIPPFSPQLSQIVEIANAGQLDNMMGDHYLFSLIHFFADDEFLKIEDVREYNLNFFNGKTRRTC